MAAQSAGDTARYTASRSSRVSQNAVKMPHSTRQRASEEKRGLYRQEKQMQQLTLQGSRNSTSSSHTVTAPLHRTTRKNRLRSPTSIPRNKVSLAA